MIAGVLVSNLLFAGVGYALLWRTLRGRTWTSRLSWAGVALLLGAGSVGTAVFFAAISGARATLAVAVACSAALIGVGLLFRFDIPERATNGISRIQAALFGVVAGVCLLGVVGGFRSSPWLDDAWGIWLPKGLALWHHGLDERLFVPNGIYVTFGVPDYPLWWSIVTSLDVQASVGGLDVRVMSAQLAVLVAAFVGAVARLLWGVVRPAPLAVGLLLLVLSPELWRQVQGGVADLALAIYVALFALALAAWAIEGAKWWLLVAAIAGASAVQIKTEGLGEVLIAGLVAVAFVPRARRAGVGIATGIAAAAALPWLGWQLAHDVPSRSPLGDWVDRSYLAERSERLGPTLEDLASRSLDPRSWLLLVPLAIALAGIGFIRDRRLAWLAPVVGLVLGFVFLVWAYWANPDPIGFLLSTSAYRTVDPLVLTSAVAIPLLLDRLLR
ncbi:MAG TPA: hypothetical protein VFP31_05750 [Gaiellaceae bacterium]|nr:hypothetical protein [Gaiellaceae bacterium]